MTLTTYDSLAKKTLHHVAAQMLLAAKTAPKGRGIDNLAYAILENESIKNLATQMKAIGEKENVPSFIRDADNIEQSSVVVLLGARIRAIGLKKCGLCGFTDCQERNEKSPQAPCVFNVTDLGIAMGSAVSVAMNHRVDNRIMYTAGIAAAQMKLLGDDVKIIYVIPLSATEKNPYFDRNK